MPFAIRVDRPVYMSPDNKGFATDFYSLSIVKEDPSKPLIFGMVYSTFFESTDDRIFPNKSHLHILGPPVFPFSLTLWKENPSEPIRISIHLRVSYSLGVR